MIKHGYSPIRPLEKHVSHEKMREILASRLEKAARAAAPNSAAPMVSRETSIEWGKPQCMGPGTAMLKSLDGRYRIDRVESQAFVGYTSWALFGGELGLNRRLGVADDSALAKRLCQADADAKAAT